MQVDVAAGLGQRGILRLAHEELDHALDRNFRLAPPAISRALAGLIERGGVHRRELLNSLVARGYGRRGHVPILPIEEECGVLEEAFSPQFADERSMIAGPSGFAPARQGLEVRGPCACCRSDEASA